MEPRAGVERGTLSRKDRIIRARFFGSNRFQGRSCIAVEVDSSSRTVFVFGKIDRSAFEIHLSPGERILFREAQPRIDGDDKLHEMLGEASAYHFAETVIVFLREIS